MPKNAQVATNGDATQTQPNQPTQPQETLAMMAATAQVKNSTGATMSWPQAFNFYSSSPSKLVGASNYL